MVILHIENKSAPLRGRKIINLPQNRVMNFQKFPYSFKNLRISFKIIVDNNLSVNEIMENESLFHNTTRQRSGVE